MRWFAVALSALAVAGCGADEEREPAAGGAATTAGALETAPPTTEPAVERTEPVRRMGAVVEQRTQLRREPEGTVVSTVKRRTSFGSRTVLAVVARHGDWLGVLHHSYKRGRRTAWIAAGAVRTLERRYEIVVDRSRLRATLRRDGKVVQRFRVGVGRAGNATPLGRYAITDRLTADAGSPYGCCILALTGRQPSLPQGWAGGDRIAFHGGPEWRVGIRTTSGCMTVSARPLRRMFARITAGTRVTIKA